MQCAGCTRGRMLYGECATRQRGGTSVRDPRRHTRERLSDGSLGSHRTRKCAKAGGATRRRLGGHRGGISSDTRSGAASPRRCRDAGGGGTRATRPRRAHGVSPLPRPAWWFSVPAHGHLVVVLRDVDVPRKRPAARGDRHVKLLPGVHTVVSTVFRQKAHPVAPPFTDERAR